MSYLLIDGIKVNRELPFVIYDAMLRNDSGLSDGVKSHTSTQVVSKMILDLYSIGFLSASQPGHGLF